METPDIPPPANWPNQVRLAMLHVASLAHWAIIYARSWAADSNIQRVRLAGELDRARNEISLLQEELRIIKMRFAKIPARHRPYYPPTERMAILELKAMRGWNPDQTVQHFMVEKQTIASWARRVDDNSLIRTCEPINKFPELEAPGLSQISTSPFSPTSPPSLVRSSASIKIEEVAATAGFFVSTLGVGSGCAAN